METKIFEIRDKATFFAAVATLMEPDPARDQEYLLSRSGYSKSVPCILYGRADGKRFHYDPYDWEYRTNRVAHEYIVKNWATLKDGDVIDVEYILKETSVPKRSERFDYVDKDGNYVQAVEPYENGGA